MALVHWQPVGELNSLQHEINRLFNSFFETPSGSVPATDGPRQRWLPAMDLREDQDAYVLHADLPGLAEEDLSIDVEDDQLTVAGERRREERSEQGGYVRTERAMGSFRRTLTLPEGVDAEAISARFEHGVLEVRIPKPAERQPRRVAVQVGSGPTTVEGREGGDPEDAEA